jgi:hypothetical protein
VNASSQLIPCPAGCGRMLHRRAEGCPQCGFRGELTGFEELLGSLSTVSSILVGFGLSAIVSIATAEEHRADDEVSQIAAGCWIASAIIFLAVMLTSEILRRREVGSRIEISDAEEERIWVRCVRLLWVFSLALFLTAIGLVLLAFHISLIHGLCGAATVVLAFFTIFRVLR